MLRDSATLALVIQTYGKSKQFNKGKQLHAQLILSGRPLCTFLTNHLITLYSKCGEIDTAFKLFEVMSQRNLVSWTTMISGFSQNSMFSQSVKTFSQMRIAGENPTQFAFSSAIQACAALGSVEYGKQLHCDAMRCGYGSELFVGSNLVDMYSKFGVMTEAYKVFEEMPCKDEVLWTALIDGYVKNGDSESSLFSYKTMINGGNVIDQHIFCCTLGACGSLKALNFGKRLHSSIVKLGFEFQIYVGNALTDMYSKSGDMESASNVFGIDCDYKSIVYYTSLIDGYVETNQCEKAFNVFLDLRRQGIDPNEFTFSTLFKAAANQGSFEQGTQLHAQVIRFNLVTDPFISSILVDMYGKCGLLDYSIRVFTEIEIPTETAWNSMVNSYAQHGFGKAAIDFFHKMVHEGVKPNGITFVSLLMGCSHAGLVDEGLNYVYSMQKTYGVTPSEEHYSCVIDLLGRAGRLQEAEEFINCMPFEPNAFGWCSFLGACKIHGDIERGKLAAEKLTNLEPKNSGVHVLLSNMYAKERKWEDVRHLRKMMRDTEMKKLPGFSWVDVGSKIHVFGAEDWSHPQKKEIYAKLDSLLDEIKEAGYEPNTESLSFHGDENAKEKLLHHHSERIAIAFALISLPIGKPIIVKKNLRMCIDCHSAIKYISKVVGRKIIVRDNSRFHHFAEGLCSCGDYW